MPVRVSVPVVSAQCGFASRFFAFCSLSPVVNHIASSAQIASNGVTWGRPSRRTVHSWNFWIRRSAHSVASHGVGVAPGVEKGPTSVNGVLSSCGVGVDMVVSLAIVACAGACGVQSERARCSARIVVTDCAVSKSGASRFFVNANATPRAGSAKA